MTRKERIALIAIGVVCANALLLIAGVLLVNRLETNHREQAARINLIVDRVEKSQRALGLGDKAFSEEDIRFWISWLRERGYTDKEIVLCLGLPGLGCADGRYHPAPAFVATVRGLD